MGLLNSGPQAGGSEGTIPGLLGWGIRIASRGGGVLDLRPRPQPRGAPLPYLPIDGAQLGLGPPPGRSGGTGALGPQVARPPPIAPQALLSPGGRARGAAAWGRTEVAPGRAPRWGPPAPAPLIAAPARPARSRGHSPGAPLPCPARRARRRPRGPQEAPRPPAPPAAPSALRPRQALPGSERGWPRAAAGAAGTCSSPAPASAVAIAAPAPRASLCPGRATGPRGRAFVCAGLRPRCPRRCLSSSASLPAALDPSPPLSLSLCPFSVPPSLYFHVLASLVTFSASIPLSLHPPPLSPCLCLQPVSPTLSLFLSLVSRNTEQSLSLADGKHTSA